MITETYSHPLYFLSKLGILTQISASNLDLSTKSNSKSLKDSMLSSKGERISKKALNSLTNAYSEYGIDLKNEKEDISYENGKYYLNIVKDSVYTCENNDCRKQNHYNRDTIYTYREGYI